MTRYWASYGRSGFLGCFEGELEYRRGDRVAVQSPRGCEIAEILECVDSRFEREIDGRILNDEPVELCQEIPATVFESAEPLPVLIADAETLLDGTLILHIMPWEQVDLTEWVKTLSVQLGRQVRLLNLTELPREKPSGCGKPDCGGGGCNDCGSGCSTGNCSRGSLKNPEELTKYFQGLRQQMESRRASLV